ncbi:hypothetical protein BH10PLA2_BH10PLA2_10370 [soil metagenome]
MFRVPLARPGRLATGGKDSCRPSLEALEERCLLAADFHTLPVIPAITQSMKNYLQSVFQQGQSQGLRANVFAKVGDSNTSNSQFLDGLGSLAYNPSNPANVGSHTDLADTINFFRQTSIDPSRANSFNHNSAAAYGGWTTVSLMTPGLKGVPSWQFGSPKNTPLDSEIRDSLPAIALVMVGTCEIGQEPAPVYQANLTAVAQTLLAKGVIPVLSTIPENFMSTPGLIAMTAVYNQVIANVAGNLNIPLWNLYVGLSQLPNEGIAPDGVHLNSSPAGAQYLDDANLAFGMNYRNLTAVQVLSKIVNIVENDGAAEKPPQGPTVPVIPFVASIFQSILQRPVDAGGLGRFSYELNQGVTPGVVVQQLWNSPEHRQLQIAQFYLQIFHRPADAPGLGWWQQGFANGMNEAQVQQAMLASQEYSQMHPTDADFVTSMYGDILQRLPSASEGVIWVNRLSSGSLTRPNMPGFFVLSGEAQKIAIDQVYLSFLGRRADDGGTAFGAGLLAGDQGGGDRQRRAPRVRAVPQRRLSGSHP